MTTLKFLYVSCFSRPNNIFLLCSEEIPMGETAFDGISLEHVGEIVGGILAQGPKAFGKDYAVSAGKLTVEEMASIMSRQLHPADIRDAKVSAE